MTCDRLYSTDRSLSEEDRIRLGKPYLFQWDSWLLSFSVDPSYRFFFRVWRFKFMFWMVKRP